MENYKRFEDLEIWKESMEICKEIYNVFQGCKDFGFRDQIQRSAVSIPSNIAEGYERKGTKEKIHFMHIAKGSCGELRTQLYLAISFCYVDASKGESLTNRMIRLNVMIYNYIRFLSK